MIRIRNVLSLLLCVGVLLGCLAAVPNRATTVYAASLSELQEQLDAAKAEANSIKSQIAALEKANAPYEEQRAAILKQISATQREIDLYQAKIEALESDISKLEKTIAQTELDLKKAIRAFKQRLVSLYTSGGIYNGLELLGGSDDVAASLARLELMESVSKKDSEAMQAMLDAIDALETQTAQLAVQKEDLASSQDIINQKKADLTAQYQKVNAIVVSNDSAIAALEKKERDYARMEKDIAAAIEKKRQEEAAGSGTSVTGTGQLAWPVPGFYTLSEAYGPRICPIHGRENHGGIDISSSGIYGAKIVAADSGTVLLSSWYGGYGNCVMLDHGNGYVTLYAHMKAPSPLSVGATVTKGQTVVGYVGSTGNSTGPHLHFEIRKNGSTVNPMSFF